MNFAKVLSDEQIYKIRHAGQELLENTGFKVEDDETLRDIGQAAGCERIN